MARDRIPLGDRVEVLDRCGWRCWFCGCEVGAGNATVCCLTPVARGGTTEPANLGAACVPCSSIKNRKTVEEYRAWLWERSCDAARVATALNGLLRQFPGLPGFHAAAIKAIANRLAVTVPAISFFGERRAPS